MARKFENILKYMHSRLDNKSYFNTFYCITDMCDMEFSIFWNIWKYNSK